MTNCVLKSLGTSGLLSVLLAAFVPFANFAAVNVGEDVPISKLCLYSLAVAVGGLLLSIVIQVLTRATAERVTFTVSAFLLLFFCFSVTEQLTGANGILLLVIHGAVMLLGCAVLWLLAKHAAVRRFWLSALGLMLVLSIGTYSVRWSRLESASVPAAPRGDEYPANTTRLDYQTLGTTSAVIPADPARITATDGASFLGAGLAPHRANAKLRVHVVANTYSETDTTAVIAVFRTGQRAPVALRSKPVSARGRALFDITFDVAAEGRSPVNFVVNAGTAGVGTLLINGPDLASKPVDVIFPYISVTEIDQPELDVSVADRRNVYYLTLDTYPRADVLKEIFGFDNTPFLDVLRTRGFSIANRSHANYMGTDLSVSAAMEQRLIVDESDTNFWNKMPWFIAVMNGRNRVFQHFQDLGYFVAKLNFWELCPPDAFVDYCYLKKATINPWMGIGITDLELSLMQLSPLYTLLSVADPDFLKNRMIAEDMDDVMRLVKANRRHSPRFIYTHIFLPHVPYRFNADCTWATNIDIDGAHSRDPKHRFLDQVKCANRKAIEYVDDILGDDPGAIILINSDHGSAFTVDWALPYDRWPEAMVWERFSNLAAMRLPDRCKSLVYDSISPVNYFELVFACIERRQPKYGEDRIYISTFEKSHPQYGQVWQYR